MAHGPNAQGVRQGVGGYSGRGYSVRCRYRSGAGFFLWANFRRVAGYFLKYFRLTRTFGFDPGCGYGLISLLRCCQLPTAPRREPCRKNTRTSGLSGCAMCASDGKRNPNRRRAGYCTLRYTGAYRWLRARTHAYATRTLTRDGLVPVLSKNIVARRT